MNPNVTALTSQVSMHQPKYQMAHIPLQTFSQSDLGNNDFLNLCRAGELELFSYQLQITLYILRSFF